MAGSSAQLGARCHCADDHPRAPGAAGMEAQAEHPQPHTHPAVLKALGWQLKPQAMSLAVCLALGLWRMQMP
jgi:hypothetical protein